MALTLAVSGQGFLSAAERFGKQVEECPTMTSGRVLHVTSADGRDIVKTTVYATLSHVEFNVEDQCLWAVVEFTYFDGEREMVGKEGFCVTPTSMGGSTVKQQYLDFFRDNKPLGISRWKE